MSAETHDTGVAMTTVERRSVGVIALIATIRMFGLFALLPVLSPYARELEGSTSLLAGLAVGAYGLTAAGFQVPLGALSDRIGRIPVIVIGLLIFVAGCIVAALSETIYGLIAGRLLQGAGAISATLAALITDATRAEVRTRSMALFGVGIGASFLFAMVAGPLLASRFGIASIFWISAVLAIFAAALLKLVPATPVIKQTSNWNLLPALRPDLLRIDFGVFLLHAIMTATFVALPFQIANRLQLPADSFWKIVAGALLAGLLIAVPMIMKDGRRGDRKLLSAAVALILVAQLMLTFLGSSTPLVFVALMLYLGGFTFLEASLPARLSLLADESLRGASLGVFSTAQFLGAFCGGLIGGRFLASGHPADVFFVCSLLAAIWLSMQGLGSRRQE